jgi:hypothetical protein
MVDLQRALTGEGGVKPAEKRKLSHAQGKIRIKKGYFDDATGRYSWNCSITVSE